MDNLFKLKKSLKRQIIGQELLAKYNAPSVITPDEEALNYIVIYYESEDLGRLMAKVFGNAEYKYITYTWLAFKHTGGSWTIFEKSIKNEFQN